MEMLLTALNRSVCTSSNTIKELREVLAVRCVNVRLYGSSRGKEFPEYNYKLPGLGKRSPKSFSHQNLSIDVNGEVLFGIHPISLALRTNKRKFYQLFIKENTRYREEGKRILEQAEKLNVPVTTVTKNDLDVLSGSRPNQGMCMDVSRLPVSVASTSICWTEIKSRWRYPVWLMPYNVQDPMNFGAILRTSFFLGVDRVLAPEKNSCRLSPVVSKASSGALEVMEGLARLREEGDIVQILQNWREAGGQVVGASTNHNVQIPVTPLQDLAVDAPVLIVVGNEEQGISSAVMGQCSRAVFVPGADTGLGNLPGADTGLVDSLSTDTGLVDSTSADNRLVDSPSAETGLVDSLNVSVATGIIIYHIISNNERTKE